MVRLKLQDDFLKKADLVTSFFKKLISYPDE